MKDINRVSLLSIGDELLIGQVVNTNASWISQRMTEYGFEIGHHLSVADKQEDIIAGLSLLSQHTNIVVVTGGLGPTKDDITKLALATYFNDTLDFHEETYERLAAIMKRYGRTIQDSQREQCRLPSKATIYENNMGTAPGMYFDENDVHYFFMPGVPFVIKTLFTERFVPILKAQGLISDRVKTETILTAGIGESSLEEKITDIVETFPKGLGISYLPGKAQVRLRLTGHDIDQLIIDAFVKKIVDRLGDKVFGFGDETLASVVGRLAIEKGLQVGFAESCTGGAVSAQITAIPGASAYFKGSIISYANEIKEEVLHVSPETIEKHGAVSAECVEEMVAGALDVLDIDIAVAISGIAGPTGGSEEKPVGTVFIAVGDKHEIKSKRLVAAKSRDVNIDYFTSYALNLLRLFLVRGEEVVSRK